MKYLFAHNDRNLVKVGDKVKQYETPIGTIGTANGAYYAHLQCSVSDGLSPAELKAYVNNWTKDKVKQHYIKPDCDFSKMFKEKVDVGNMGYDWLDWYGKGYHPGLDINGLGGGNTDKGYEFKSPIDGEVIVAENWSSGWGNIIIIEEKTMDTNEQFKKSLEKIADSRDFDYGKNMNGNESERLAKEVSNEEPTVCDTEEIEQELKDCQDENKKLKKRLKDIGILAEV